MKRDIDTSELIDLISAGYLKWEVKNLLSLACTLQDLKLSLSAAGVGGLTVGDFDFPHGICDMADDCFQSMISQHTACEGDVLEVGVYPQRTHHHLPPETRLAAIPDRCDCFCYDEGGNWTSSLLSCIKVGEKTG